MTIKDEAGPKAPPAVAEYALEQLTNNCSCGTCGYTWKRGQRGDHSCAQVMEATVADLRARLAKYEDAEGLPVVVVDSSVEVAALSRFVETVRECYHLASSYSGCLDNVDEHGGDDHEDPICAVFHRLYYAMFDGDKSLAGVRTALESQAREIERLKEKARKAAAIGIERNQAAKQYQAELAALKAQPSGVVLPERKPVEPLDFNRTTADVDAIAHNACLDEVARLNPARGVQELVGHFVQPYMDRPEVIERVDDSCSSDPDVFPLYRFATPTPAPTVAHKDDPRSPAELSLAGCNCVRFGEGNPHWPCKLHTPVSACGVDERAAFEADELRRHPGAPLFRMPESHSRAGQYQNQYVESAWRAWQARAALSAPTYRAYTTTPGEAVAGIALRQLGDESRWVEIRDLNAHAFPDIGPHDYYPVGTELRLPALSAPSHGEQVREGLRELLDMLVESDLRKIRYASDWRKEVHSRAVSLRDALTTPSAGSQEQG